MTSSLWTSIMDSGRARQALTELGFEHLPLYVEYNYDALTLGTGDGTFLHTVVVPTETTYRVKTDRYKQGGFKFFAVLSPAERSVFKRLLYENPHDDLLFHEEDGMIVLHVKSDRSPNEPRTFLVTDTMERTRTETQPVQMVRGLLGSVHHFRIDMRPDSLATLVNVIRPRENNDAVIMQWKPKQIYLTGLSKKLDEQSDIVVTPNTTVCPGSSRKKSPWPGSVVINMQGRNAVKVNGGNLHAALNWLGEDAAIEVHVGSKPLAVVLRRKTPIARYALLMQQRFLPEELRWLDQTSAK